MGSVPQLQSRPKRRFLFLLFLLPLGIVALVPVTNDHLRAVSLLLRIQNVNDTSRLARYHTYPVTEKMTELPTAEGLVRARLYVPSGIGDPPGMVVVHGVHHLGVNEPRLMAFSRALAESGVEVFTPELPDLADYQITPASIEVIGEAAHHLSADLGATVGVLGLSFAGGEALLAAANPQYEKNIGFVVSIGAHDDMHRVAEFYVSGKIARPDGTTITMKPHEYGPLVLLYSHAEEFFPASDVPAARHALKLLLWEEVADSKVVSKELSPASQQKMGRLYEHDSSEMDPAIAAAIDRHAREMAAVSPHDHLQSLHVPVLLLHGSGDDVIPATEMLWLSQDVPEPYLRDALITPLLSHVDIAKEPPLREKLALVHLMAQLIELADDSRSRSRN